MQAHHAAVAEVLAYMEREVAATRTGTTAQGGAVAQADVTGLSATAFDHFDSQAGDPHLPTHVVISNKVQTVLDGKWRSLDGRPMHEAVVALSELYEALFADELTRSLGVQWERRERERGERLPPRRGDRPCSGSARSGFLDPGSANRGRDGEAGAPAGGSRHELAGTAGDRTICQVESRVLAPDIAAFLARIMLR